MSSYQGVFAPLFAVTAIVTVVVIGWISYRVIRLGRMPQLSSWNGQRNTRQMYELRNELYPGSRLVRVAKSLTWLGFAIGMLWLYTSYRSQRSYKTTDGVSVSDRAR